MKQVKSMARCTQVDCPKNTDWAFSTHEERAAWVGKHRLETGHSVDMWLGPQ